VNLIAGDLAGKHLVVSGEPVIVDDATLWSYGTSKDSGQGGHRDRPNAECVACGIQQILNIGRGQAIVFLCGQGTDASPFCSFFICSDALAYVLTLKFSVSVKCPHLVTNTYGTITAHQHGEAGASLLLRFANFEGFSVADFHEAGRARLCIGAPEVLQAMPSGIRAYKCGGGSKYLLMESMAGGRSNRKSLLTIGSIRLRLWNLNGRCWSFPPQMAQPKQGHRTLQVGKSFGTLQELGPRPSRETFADVIDGYTPDYNRCIVNLWHIGKNNHVDPAYSKHVTTSDAVFDPSKVIAPFGNTKFAKALQQVMGLTTRYQIVFDINTVSPPRLLFRSPPLRRGSIYDPLPLSFTSELSKSGSANATEKDFPGVSVHDWKMSMDNTDVNMGDSQSDEIETRKNRNSQNESARASERKSREQERRKEGESAQEREGEQGEGKGGGKDG